jgi:uncharacterized coiled-coil protein SlyX
MNLQNSNEEILITNKTSQYETTLETLKTQLPAILVDFQKYYILYNQNVSNDENRQMLESIKGNITTLSNGLFTLSNNTQVDIDKINEQLVELNILIEKEKERNRMLKLKLSTVENKNNASYEMISNYKQNYEYGYLRNWGLFLSIIIAGITISKVFTTNQIVTTAIKK